MVGVLAANRDARRLRRLVLVSPSPRYINDDDYIGGFEQTDIEALLDSLDANYLGWSQQTAPVIMGTPERPGLQDRLTDSFCQVDPQIAGHFARVTFTGDNRGDLPLVRVPTLVLQCRDDVIAPTAVGCYVHSAIPGSRFAIVDTTGHVPILSAPDEVAARVRGFMS
jgi:sigma-B regulation protein RsbQ